MFLKVHLLLKIFFLVLFKSHDDFGKSDYNKKDPFCKYLLFLYETFFDFLIFLDKTLKIQKNLRFLFSKIPLFAPILTIFPVIKTQKHVDMESLNKIGRWS